MLSLIFLSLFVYVSFLYVFLCVSGSCSLSASVPLSFCPYLSVSVSLLNLSGCLCRFLALLGLCLCVILCISVFVSLCYLLSVFSFPSSFSLCSVSLFRQLNSCQIFLEENSGVCYNYTNSQPTEGWEPTTQVFLPNLRKGQLETKINEGLILIFFF